VIGWHGWVCRLIRILSPSRTRSECSLTDGDPKGRTLSGSNVIIVIKKPTELVPPPMGVHP
jgi:hypothetical protein